MWPDRVSNPGSLAYEADALPTVQCGPAILKPLFLQLLVTEDCMVHIHRLYLLLYVTALCG